MIRGAATRDGSWFSARQPATSYAGEEIGSVAAPSLAESSARGDTSDAPMNVGDAEPGWRRRKEARFMHRPACADVAGRLMVAAHEARLRFSASGTVGALDESDEDR